MKRDTTMRAQDLTSTQPISLDVLKEKYLKPGEDGIEDLYRRVARALAAAEKEDARAEWEQRFLANLHAGAIGAGRIMSAAGTDIQATLINCFVQPVGDAIQGVDADGYPGIYEALREAAETMRRGGGVGYDFSRIRPKGAEVKGTHSMASGPCSYINVFDQSCATVESAGARRGAQMGVLRIDHPDVLEFITAKRTPGRWNNFNVSVGVSDDFMEALDQDQPWELVHQARPGAPLMAKGAYQRADAQWVYQTIAARELWDAVMRSAYDFAEPGILFLDHIRQDNNLRYCETISATNPCVSARTRLATQHGLVAIGQLHAEGVALQVTVDQRALGACRTLGVDSEKRPQRGQFLPDLQTNSSAIGQKDGENEVSACEKWTAAIDLQPTLPKSDRLLGQPGGGVSSRAAQPAFMTARNAEVFRVATAEGYEIEATAWHEFYTGRGKLKLSELRIDDTLWVQSGKGQFGSQGSDALGFALGLIAADGCCTRHDTGQEAGQEAATLPRWDEQRALADAHSQTLQLFGGNRQTELQVPELVWRGSEACVKAYLRGLFQLAGTVDVSGAGDTCSVRLSSSQRPLLRDVQLLLSNLGVLARLQQRQDVGQQPPPDRLLAQHELVIEGASRDIFMHEVGFLLPAKQAIYQTWANGQTLCRQQRFEARVTAITPIGRQPVFDTTQMDHNTVIFNGLVTGQCGEQPLPPYGCCDLGPVILTRFVRNPFGFGGAPAFDFEAFEQVVATQVRALDNVLDVTFWPLPQQREEARAKRRIGVGFTGLGNALAMLCLRYDRDEGRTMAAAIAQRMRDAAYTASVALAQEKGAFPKFDADGYLASGTFASRLPAALQQAIRCHGIRNSHLLSIAPTGTVSLAFADNASNGIEPPFSWVYRRKKRESDGSTREYAVEDHAWRLYRELGGAVEQLPAYFVSALAMSAADHIAMMQSVQPFVDTAISKTVNVAADYPFDDFKNLYHTAWRAQLKGLATYRPNSILGSVLDSDPAPAAALATAAPDPMRTVIESRPKGPLSAVADKIEYWTQEGHKTLYIIVSFLPVPVAEGSGTVERAIEFFMPVGQSGESQQWITSTMRMLSLAARGGFLERALSDMRKVAWDRGPVRLGTYQKADGTQVPMWHDSEVAAIAFALQNLIARRAQLGAGRQAPAPASQAAALAGVMAGKKCPECGAHALIRKDGCDYCTQCGHLGICG